MRRDYNEIKEHCEKSLGKKCGDKLKQLDNVLIELRPENLLGNTLVNNLNLEDLNSKPQTEEIIQLLQKQKKETFAEKLQKYYICDHIDFSTPNNTESTELVVIEEF